MSLLAIKTYLVDRHRAPLRDIALHLRSSPEAVRGEMEVWIAKGKVRRLEERCGGGCCRCGDTPEVYEWVE